MCTRWRTVVWLLLVTVGMGAIPGLVALMFRGLSAREFAGWVLQGTIYSTCIGIPCWAVIPRVMGAKRPYWARTLIAVSLLGLFGVLGCLAANVIMGRPAAAFWWSLRVCLLITFSFGVLALAIGTLQARLATAKEQLHQREIAAAQARYASLESRVHPHFLFNTLNSISALVREEPAEAERMIERLSALLRYSLDSEAAGVVALGEELRIVRDYLEIEKIRFGSRLVYRVETEAEADRHMVPAFSIQTLVENSVKFAVGPSRDGAEIVISARIREGKLRVEVSDNGPGFEPALSRKPGHGLDLLERRLASLFGASASLEMGTAEGRTLVAISVTA